MVVDFVEMWTLEMEHERIWGKPKQKGNRMFQATRQGSFSALPPNKDLDKNLIRWPTCYLMGHGKQFS